MLAVRLLLGVLISMGYPSVGSVGRRSMSFLQWNPHWQCFAWDHFNCTKNMEAVLNVLLDVGDLDFANLVMVEDANLSVPIGWEMIRSTCDGGNDPVILLYNTRRWTATALNRSGCEVQNDRPWVLQEFVATSDSFNVIAIGAHFPHPHHAGGDMSNLKSALLHIQGKSGTRNVVMMADTNHKSHYSSDSIFHSLGVRGGFPGPEYVSSSLERTCCFDYNFPRSYTFDRIIANFGYNMVTTVLYPDALPYWANQTEGNRKGAFHKPIRGILLFTEQDQKGGALGSSSFLSSVLVSVLSVLVVVIAALLLWVWKLKQSNSGGDSDSDSSDKTYE